jgi:cation diffusion facilitator CzcD-associated flavoprotein CzcO
MPEIETSCLILGAGPAGLAPLLAAARSEKLQELLDAGVVVVEKGTSVGAGDLGSYSISSDSAAEAFLDAISDMKYPQLTSLSANRYAERIRRRIGDSVPLKLAARLQLAIGEALCGMVSASPRGRVMLQTRALSTRRTCDGQWLTSVQDVRTGTVRTIRSKSVVMAMGAEQPLSRLYTERVAGEPLLPKRSAKIVQSGFALTGEGLRQIRKDLAQHENPRVVIIGSSASAGAVARVLLSEKAKISFGENGVSLLARKPLRIFYPSAVDALRDGYTDFGPEDICPVSGRVFRLAGFRLETRELMKQVLRVGGRVGEPRLNLHMITADNDAETAKLLDEAHVIVAAMGYRPRSISVFDTEGKSWKLQSQTDEMVPAVDRNSRVLDDRGRQMPGLYGTGLASGFVPRGRFGGEASFKGQANSLWLWQHDIGEQIADAALQDAIEASNVNVASVYQSFAEALPVQKGAA